MQKQTPEDPYLGRKPGAVRIQVLLQPVETKNANRFDEKKPNKSSRIPWFVNRKSRVAALHADENYDEESFFVD